MGRFLVTSPHLDTVIVAGETILAAGTEEQRERVLPAIARGDTIVGLALIEAAGGPGARSVALTAERRGDDFVLNGTKLLVGFAPSADSFLLTARTSDDGVSLFLVDASSRGIAWTRMPNIAGQALYAVAFDGMVVPHDAVVGDVDAGWEALSPAITKGALLQTVTIVGAAYAVLEMTNQYAKDREQFGRPIGAYQAVQYMVSDILIDAHRAELLAKQAVFRVATGRPAAREAAMAIAFGKRAAAHLHRQAHEVHAGVAFMLEHDLTLYSRRSKFWENNLGDARYWQEQLAEAMQI